MVAVISRVQLMHHKMYISFSSQILRLSVEHKIWKSYSHLSCVKENEDLCNPNNPIFIIYNNKMCNLIGEEIRRDSTG